MAYGAGQIVNGILCKFYNKKFIITFSLLSASAINLAVGLFSVNHVLPFGYVKYLWLLNGISQSFLWASLLSVLGKYLDKKYLPKSIFMMSTTVAIGTFVSYGLSAVFSFIDGGFKFSFIFAAVSMTTIGLIWCFQYNSLIKDAPTADQLTDHDTKEDEIIAQSKNKKNAGLIILIGILGLFGVLGMLIRDGLNTWVPSILKDTYHLPDYLSILCTLILPVLAIFGTKLVIALNKKFSHFVTLIGVLFVFVSILTVSVLLMIYSNVYILWVPILVCFGLIALLLAGTNNVITSMAPLMLRDKINSGLLAGILNAFCYVGSSLSSLLLPLLVSGDDWLPVFILFSILSIVTMLTAILYTVFTKLKRKKA